MTSSAHSSVYQENSVTISHPVPTADSIGATDNTQASTTQTHPQEIDEYDTNTIFKRGSTTYFYSSLFFPKTVRAQIADLYAFVRIADDFVDQIPQNATGFHDFCNAYRAHQSNTSKPTTTHTSATSHHLPTGVLHIINNFQTLQDSLHFDPAWTEAFLAAMQADLTKTSYATLEELKTYMHGSAEVVGLYLSRILGIPQEADIYSQKLGQAMQYINFIRDIAEDITFGRIYIPQTELARYAINPSDFIPERLTTELKDNFCALIRAQIDIYYTWQREAEQGYRFIPRRYLIPIKTASEMYKYTARVIHKNPLILFERKVKPSKKRILARGLLETLSI